ncbi:hypothetical protein ACGFX4_16250 [Kitasatospora sp. NPDC048365]|uniref:hypothetical protein n=1 Tax=Kitasatospora sp. NPDC048365 TaxID=3364050 RepID=UPI003722AC34
MCEDCRAPTEWSSDPRVQRLDGRLYNDKAGTTIKTPGGTDGATTLAAWAKQGYLPDGANGGNGTDLPGSVAGFAKAKNPDLAAASLDFMNIPEAAQIQFDTGFLPVAHADTVKGARTWWPSTVLRVSLPGLCCGQ